MVSIDTFREWALALPGAVEQPHFHLASFRVNKKIFATIREKENRVMLKLTPVDQSVFCAFDDTVFFPVPGVWGAKGATFVSLAKVRKDMLKDALVTAYNTALAKKNPPKKQV